MREASTPLGMLSHVVSLTSEVLALHPELNLHKHQADQQYRHVCFLPTEAIAPLSQDVPQGTIGGCVQ